MLHPDGDGRPERCHRDGEAARRDRQPTAAVSNAEPADPATQGSGDPDEHHHDGEQSHNHGEDWHRAPRSQRLTEHLNGSSPTVTQWSRRRHPSVAEAGGWARRGSDQPVEEDE
jgi:hypothetical protein